MSRTKHVKFLAMLLAVVMCVSLLQPGIAFAATGVADYESFLSNLKVLEGYADEYAAANSNQDAKELVINFIRTGVERYNDGNWKTLAGEEITGFTSYVEAQDVANNTTAMLLRNIITDDFKLPNGNQVDFGHMFGTLNIAYINAQGSADLGGWAGDICDLILYSKNYGSVPAGTVDEMAAYIKEYCFGVDADDAFGMDDFYGDLDAFYLNDMIKAGSKLSTVMETYFTVTLSDSDRAAYFLNNRFKGVLTQEEVRTAIYDAYASNVGLKVLEADRGISGDADLRTASCYAFADYLFEQGGDRLEGDTGEGEGGEGEGGSGEAGKPMDNDYYSVFYKNSSVLAPGIEQTIKYAMTADNKQIVYYVATVDVTRDDVTIMANYRDNDPSKGWGMQRVEDQAIALMNKHTNPADPDNYIENFQVVVATNGDGYNMSTGKPGGLLVMEGVEWHPVDGDGFFAILKDGTAMIGTQADYTTYKNQIQEAIGGFGAVLIKNGEIVVGKASNYPATRASRTAIGITAEGKVVMMCLDGRQEPFSAGGALEEIAQIMLEAGCVQAINLDGGGSTTYLSKPEGSDKLELVSSPSDGYARSVSTSLVAVSTAKSSKEFDHANISSEYDYLTIGTSLSLSAVGVSNTGNAAQLPENLVWQVSDSTLGSVTADGVFTAAANGDVEVQLVLDGNVVGTKVLHVVVPDAVGFEKNKMNVIFGVPTKIPVTVSYNGNPVAFTENDIWLGLDVYNAGSFEGFMFTADETVGLRSVRMAALLLANQNVMAMMNVNMYKDGEAVFDFDDVTAGDRNLAWDRDIINAGTVDNFLYYIDDITKAMDITYVFGLDMQAIEIPEKLKELTYMLPGGDLGDATAWDYLLQLAERVSTLTEVKIVAQFDKDLDVDVSGATVVNDYFYLKSVTVDENNVMTMICGWHDQTAAIQPETANPICILSGIKATPKENASWDTNNQLAIVNSGVVSYKIYLRANALYSFANIVENQLAYDLYPFINPDDPSEKGASFGTNYATFSDSFILDKTVRQGWYKLGDYHYYFVDNEALTGIHYVPSLEDPSVKLFYEFEEDGVLNGTVTGLIEKEDGLYYAYQGERLTGWRSIMNAQGKSNDYFFERTTGKAVNGVVTVDGYTYTFENYILVKGAVVTDAGGTHYRWAGRWVRNQWVEIDGVYYFAQYPVTGYFAAGGLVWARDFDGQSNHHHLFDENGIWQKDYNGLYHVGEDTYLLKNGVRQTEPGIVYLDGYYYYFCSTDKAVKNCTYWPSKTNGLLPYGPYQFDEQGRIILDTPVEPENPENPQPPKDGVVDVNGTLYYYKNDAIQYAAGLLELDDGSFIYVRSNGQLAIGEYWITNTNGLKAQGMYTFGADGKMVIAAEPEQPDVPEQPEQPEQPEDPEEPEKPVKNGVVDVNGKLYYYVNDSIAYCGGVIQLADGSYIYVRSNGQLAIGQYWVTNTNGLMNQGMRTFDESGIMLDPPATEPEQPEDPEQPETPENPEIPDVKNGIVDVNGVLYYYKNNGIFYCAGVVQLDNGDYIYVRSNGRLAIGQYWVTNTNDLMPQGMHNFDANGIMLDPPVTEPEQPENPEQPEQPEEPEQPVKNGVVEENGGLYYYANGKIAREAGLLKLTDEEGREYYIYVRSTGQVATGVYWPTNNHGLLPYKGYDFGEDGRLYL